VREVARGLIVVVQAETGKILATRHQRKGLGFESRCMYSSVMGARAVRREADAVSGPEQDTEQEQAKPFE